MRIAILSLKKALKPLIKQRPKRPEIDIFKANLVNLLDQIGVIEKQPKDESEEHLKNNVRDFLRDTYYKETNAINTKDKKDLVIHLGKTTNTDVGVIIEAKRPTNQGEMISLSNLNKKAFHELILYYLQERTNNNQLKQLIVTNIYEWYIFDANAFDKLIYRNTTIQKLLELKNTDKKDNPFFYEEVAKIIGKIDAEIPCIHFDLRDYERNLRNNNKQDDNDLISLYKILSPDYLLKIAATNDSNYLNEGFYVELLHLIGLEEAKDGNKTIIRRKKIDRNPCSLLELTIDSITTEDAFYKIPDISLYGETKEEWSFNISMELCITWINRILFLKLLEGQLIAYHQNNKDYRFLHFEMVHDFDELFKLFHKVLAINIPDRTEAIKNKYRLVPYLNSSLFEISELEDQTIKINTLDNSGELKLYSTTSLKHIQKDSKSLPILKYLFAFLDTYDFSGAGSEEIQEENKTIINASVLGKVFEKINGYKDGSIFTPASITMYMCRQSIRNAVLDTFNAHLQHQSSRSFDKFDDIKNYTSKIYKSQEILQINELINGIKLCDPAVGSGHFLVSALNELIVIKAELGILADEGGNLLNTYEIEVINDELIVTDNQGNAVDYKLQNGKPINKEVQRLQKTFFHEKQTIIENCLFGVDINPKSVLICRLRLWIELLKNAYYKEADYTELETLPNIDINIKCGNSLVSRYKLNEDLSKPLKTIKYSIKAYREIVNNYKNEKSRDVKRGLQTIINNIKNEFKTEISKNDERVIKLNKLSGELYNLLNQTSLFEGDNKQLLATQAKQKKLEADIAKLKKEIDDIRNNTMYKNAFEWRFEFPEILNNTGEFDGFDVILGNPPYIQLQKLSEGAKIALQSQQYETFTKTGDIYQLFYELGVNLLKSGGQMGFITSNKWMRTDYGFVTREYLATKCNTQLVIDFGMAQMFNSATTYTNILLLSKSAPTDTIRMCRIKNDFEETTLLEDYVDFASVDIDNPGGNSWIAYDKKEIELIKKIASQGDPLTEWEIQINYGLKTGFNDAFVISTETKDRLVREDARSQEILWPILRGEDIKAYSADWQGLWVIGTFPSLSLDITKYPAVYKYLLQFKERLTPKPRGYDDGKSGKWKGRKAGSYEWFETQDSLSYYKDFLTPKIIYPNMTKFMPFVYDKHQFFANQKCFIITGESMGYLTCFFNSKLFRFAFKEYFPELLGDTRELSKTFFETVTVKKITVEDEIHFDKLLESIQSMKEQGMETIELENKIEELIANIYSLSIEEKILIDSRESPAAATDSLITSRSGSLIE